MENTDGLHNFVLVGVTGFKLIGAYIGRLIERGEGVLN